MRIGAQWVESLKFQVDTEQGHALRVDGHADGEPPNADPSPQELLLTAIATCAGMDVISILKKKRLNVTSYRVEVEGDRTPRGEWPRWFTEIRIRHIVSGEGLSEADVARAVQLSDETYCTVSTTLRRGVPIKAEWTIE